MLPQVLIPVFALGRAQELCILLETYWERMNLTVPIYFSAGLTEKATNYYKLFIHWTNEKIKVLLRRQPFPHTHHRTRTLFGMWHLPCCLHSVRSCTGICSTSSTSPHSSGVWPTSPVLWSSSPPPACSTPAPPSRSSRNGRPTRRIWSSFRATVWSEPSATSWPLDARSEPALSSACYCLWYQLRAVRQGSFKVDLDSRTSLEVRCKVKNLSFSAHADAKGIMQLIKMSQPANVILVHGEKGKMYVTLHMAAARSSSPHSPLTTPGRDVQAIAEAACDSRV